MPDSDYVSADVPLNPPFMEKVGGAISKATIRFAANIAEKSDYRCDRIAKAAMHELGHVFGLDHPASNSPGPSVMKPTDALTRAGKNAQLDAMPFAPTCGDDAGVEFARSFTGPLPPQYGDIGQPRDCEFNGGWSDEHGCCHALPPMALSGGGFYQYPPIVHLTAPVNNAVFTAATNGQASFTVSAHALDLDGDAWRIDWAIDGQTVHVSQRSATNNSTTWNLAAVLPPKSTPYEIKAVAHDLTNAYKVSDPIYVTVNPPPSGPSVLASGEILYANQSRTSPNGAYTLVYQADGNLVLYGPTGPIIWTGTSGPALGTYMNPTGNLEVYNSGPTLAWQSGTGGGSNTGAYLYVQNDGHIVLARSGGSVVGQWP